MNHGIPVGGRVCTKHYQSLREPQAEPVDQVDNDVPYIPEEINITTEVEKSSNDSYEQLTGIQVTGTALLNL